MRRLTERRKPSTGRRSCFSQVCIFRWGFPRKNRRIFLRFLIKDIQSVRIEVKEGIYARRVLYMDIRGRGAIPLTRTDENLTPREIELGFRFRELNFNRTYMDSRKRRIVSDDKDTPADLYKEWDEASCPICMEHPHNAVLLVCSSHENGCRSYICDTSYRHSNCLDRFKKLKEENPDTTSSPPNLNPGSPLVSINSPSLEINNNNNIEKSEDGLNLKCPLCRGTVLGFKVIEEARKYLNSKLRSCSRESCPFSGNYRELRGHARRVHPTVRPADIDPSRERAWRLLEDQREYNDIVSAVPGSVVVGDYAIERSGDGVTRDAELGRDWDGQLLGRIMLFHMLRSMGGRRPRRDGTRMAGSRGFAMRRRPDSIARRPDSIARRPDSIGGGSSGGGTIRRRRYLWGENLLGLQDDRDDDEDDDDEEDDEDAVDDDEDADDDDDDDEDADDDEDEDDEVDMNMLSDIGPPRRRLRRRITPARSVNEDRR
ncbi:photosystem i assembly protein ycf4 [Phtheirospermum japonicum]|uniref:Photosystem I assembly protein Ycf4 n=1 Tax=Phtheirospermum japonicum TaxID=374723 RepID=A0A830C1P4_9LAMI|nr:photosystem i assembly protein ycf4 [Phtheirospermum japonicum]